MSEERQRNRKYDPDFKIEVVETMKREHLTYDETEALFGLSESRARAWERIYDAEGPDGLRVERRGRKRKKPVSPKKTASGTGKEMSKKEYEERIAALEAEVEYLKKVRALGVEKYLIEKKLKSFDS